jgi:hypothetical protein
MIRIVDQQGVLVMKHGLGFIERNTMLPDIPSGLTVIPLE